MHDEIGAEAQWPGQHRRRRGAVDREQRAAGLGDLGGAGDVGHRPQRVRRRLDPNEARPARTDRPAQRIERRRIDELHRETPGLGKIPQPAAQPPIHHLRGNDMSVPREALEDCGRRRHPRGKQQRGRTAFESGQERLRLVVARVVGAAVTAPAAILVVGIAHKGRRGVDRQDDGAS